MKQTKEKTKIKSRLNLSTTIANVVIKNGYIDLLEALFELGFTKTTIVKEGMKLLANENQIEIEGLDLD